MSAKNTLQAVPSRLQLFDLHLQMEEKIKKLKWLAAEKKKLETEYDEIATEVKTYLGSEQSFKNSEGHELATYKSQIQVRFNQKKLETDLPDIYEKYSKTFGLKLEFRVFKLI